jgi:hypothetical protein
MNNGTQAVSWAVPLAAMRACRPGVNEPPWSAVTTTSAWSYRPTASSRAISWPMRWSV